MSHRLLDAGHQQQHHYYSQNQQLNMNMNSNSRILISSEKGFGYLLLILTILAGIYFLSLCYQRWKKIRDFHIMEETRAHTNELADMGMDSEHGPDGPDGPDDNDIHELDQDTKGDGLL